MRNLFCLLAVLISITACSKEQNNEANQKTQVVNTGNKFKDAAINKVKQANSGFSVGQAQCVVETLTKDGVYGLGEINQMKLGADAAKQNSGKLFQAYQDALKGCK